MAPAWIILNCVYNNLFFQLNVFGPTLVARNPNANANKNLEIVQMGKAVSFYRICPSTVPMIYIKYGVICIFYGI